MEDEAILGAQQGATDAGAFATEPAADATQPQGRKVIPIPTDKWREVNRELRELRAQDRERTLSTTPNAQLNDEQRGALDLIAEHTSAPLRQELAGLKDTLDSLMLKQEAAGIETDPNASAYQQEYLDSLRELMRTNPNDSMDVLSEKARKEAVYKAYNSGKLSQALADEADEQSRTKTRLSTPPKGAVNTGRGASEKPLNQMTPEELAASGRVDEYFAMTQGRAPRR